MKNTSALLALSLALCLGGPATFAQTTTTETKAPEAGANSFTEAQAKARIEQAGFSKVTGLRKEGDGIWRATATKGDAQVNVALDFRGNVTTQ
jgi:flagellar basal body rod protein FlgG